jgi:mannose-6-phosphate isomerase-like protein (cupin superfamily)
MPRSIILSLALTAAPLLAQSTEPTVHTAADLQQREAKLIEAAKADPTGFAVATIDDYGNDRTLLVVRLHTGDAERHQLWADQIYVNKGNLTLVYGGTMQQERPNGTAPGETRGSGVEGGKEIPLHTGDIVHIPAGIPHWVKVAPGTTATYLVFKEK